MPSQLEMLSAILKVMFILHVGGCLTAFILQGTSPFFTLLIIVTLILGVVLGVVQTQLDKGRD